MNPDQDVQNGLPKGWVACSIGQVTLPVSKIDPKKSPDREIDYIDISSIDNARQIIGDVKRYRLKEAPSRARQIVRSGDVLFATVRPYLRNIASVPKHHDRQIASTGFSVLRPGPGISPAFLYYKATSQEFVNGLSGMQYGVSYPAVKDGQVRDQPLWLPPFGEQRRIVAKIDELFSELDKGVECLETARAQLKVYRQAVLKQAFKGKLTAQWREENKDKLEAPEKLLVRIEKKREAQYDRRLQDWEAAVKQWESDGKINRKPVKPKRAKSAIPVRNEDQAQLINLPKGWKWIRLAQLFDVPPQNGIYKPASEYGNGTQIIRIDDFYDGRLIRRTGFKRLRLDNDEVKKYTLRIADLMVNRVNSIEYLGKCAVVGHLTETTVFESNIMKCSFVEDEVSMAYIAAYLSSKEGRKRLCENAKHAVNQASINQTDVGNTLIPITSGEEQVIIAQKIEEKLSIADAMTTQIETHLKEAKVLQQSILKKAFSGQLVAQDPSDEPASTLLARIRTTENS